MQRAGVVCLRRRRAPLLLRWRPVWGGLTARSVRGRSDLLNRLVMWSVVLILAVVGLKPPRRLRRA